MVLENFIPAKTSSSVLVNFEDNGSPYWTPLSTLRVGPVLCSMMLAMLLYVIWMRLIYLLGFICCFWSEVNIAECVMLSNSLE